MAIFVLLDNVNNVLTEVLGLLKTNSDHLHFKMSNFFKETLKKNVKIIDQKIQESENSICIYR